MANRNSNSYKNSYWTRFTTLEKCLFLALILLLIIMLALIFTRPSDKIDTCQSEGCVIAATQVLSRIDRSVDPCEDFYLFSCRNFINNTILEDYELAKDSFSIVGDEINKRMRISFEQPVLDTDPHSIKLVKKFYKSCMNTTHINIYSVNQTKMLFNEIGGWPLIDGQHINENVGWSEIFYKFLIQTPIEDTLFFHFNVESDYKNSSRSLLTLEQPYIINRKHMLIGLETEFVKNFYEYSVALVKYFGAKEEQARNELKEVFKLHKALAEILIPEEDQRDDFERYNLKTPKQMEKEYPFIPWLQFLNNITYPVKTWTNEDTILVTVPDYFKRLAELLNTKDNRTIINYMYWTALTAMKDYLSDEIQEMKRKYIKKDITKEPRWKDCTYQVTNELNIAVSSLYVKNYFKEQGRQNMIEIVENIKNEFANTLANIEWMDKATRNEAIEKVHAMTKLIAYPDELLNDKIIDDYYKNLTINTNNYLIGKINLKRFWTIKGLEKLNRPNDRNDWTPNAGAIETNAYYDSSTNSIKFLAGILQNIFYQTERPQYMNYGAIGYIVGHEITHGFDDQGAKYDKDGNLRHWWPNETMEAFKKKAKCIQDQYSKMPVPGTDKHINGIATQGENIADNGGIKHAYLAYKNWANREGPEKSLPGLPYTPEQLFWISAGNIYCSKIKMEQLIKDIDSSHLRHSPNSFRVNVPLMNNDDFAKDFSCPVGSKMNPPKDKKCVVW